MNQTYKRLKSPTPKYFVNLRFIVGAVGAIAGAVNAAFDLPPVVDSILDMITYLSGGSFVTTFLPKKN